MAKAFVLREPPHGAACVGQIAAASWSYLDGGTVIQPCGGALVDARENEIVLSVMNMLAPIDFAIHGLREGT
jgi:hypothetical protein